MAPPAHNSRTQTLRKGRGRPKKVTSSVNPEPTAAKNKRKGKSTVEFYSVRSILDENENEYLIDWEDNSQTGEAYDPTWEPKSNANKAAIIDWEEKKKLQETNTVIEDSQSGPSALETSQDSQPIRSAKRKREQQESSSPSEPVIPTRGRGRPRGSWNKRQRLQAGFSHKVQELEIEEEPAAVVVEDEVEETYQEDAIISSIESVQVVINPPNSAFNPGDYPIFSDQFSHDTRHRATNQSSLAFNSEEFVTPAKKVIIPDSQETPVTVEKVQSESQAEAVAENQQSAGSQLDFKATAKEIASRADREESNNFEEPPSYRERAKYLDEEEVDRPCKETSQEAEENGTAAPQTPSRTSVDILQEEVGNESPQEQLGETGSSDLIQVRAPDSEPVVITSQGLIAFSPALSSASSWQTTADAFELFSPLQAEDDLEPDIVPPLVHSSDSGDRDSEASEDLQFQTQVPYTVDSVHSSTQSSQEKSSSYESVISVAKSSSDRDSEVDSSEPWQGGQVLPEVDLLSSQSSNHQSFGEAFRKEQFPQENRTHSPVDFLNSHTKSQQSPARSPLDVSEDHSITPKSPGHTSHIEAKDILASVEEDLPSPEFPPSHLIPSSGTPQYPETYGSNFPPRPDSQFNVRMEGDIPSTEHNEAPSTPQQLTITQRLKLIRAQSSPHMSTRSPSAIPERIPTPPAAHPGQMLPSHQHHIEIEEPLPEIQPPALVEAGEHGEASEMDTCHEVSQLGKNEYLVPLPMVSFVRDVYEQAVKNCKTQIKHFTSDPEVGPSSTVETIDNMIVDLRKCCTHQDLLSDPSATQAANSHLITAQWANTCSTKCMFLRQFLTEIRDLETHVVVLARPGKTLDILESILIVDNISYNRPGDHIPSSSAAASSMISPLKVTLLPTGEEGKVHVIARANMVIGFDDTFDSSERHIREIRADLYEDKLAPLVSLIVVNSVEHLDLCIPRQIDQAVRKSILISCIAHTVHERQIGILHSEDPSPDQCATRIAQYLTGGAQEWPLPPAPEATFVDLYLEDFTQDSTRVSGQAPVQEASGSITQSYDVGEGELQVPQSSLKRSWDINEEEGENSKRLRTTPQPEADSSADAVCVSDTVTETSQLHSTAAERTASLDIRSRLDNSFTDTNISWQARIAELEAELRSKTTAELKLRAYNEQLRKDVASHEKGIIIMQPRFQEALNERAAAVHEAKLALEKFDVLNSRLEARTTEVMKLKDEKSHLETELNAARQALASSAVPGIAELEKARAEAREHLEEKKKAERRLENKEKDFNFTKDSYQKASTKAGELSTEIAELKEQNAILIRKSDDNKVAINQINNDQALEFHFQRIKELKNLLRDREEELGRKYEELRVLKEGRRGTRGTSVPKSPLVNTGVHSPKITGNRSRGGSPSVGDIGVGGPSGAARDSASFFSSGGGGTGRFPPLSRLRE